MEKSIENNLAPICLFTYNRLDETRQTVQALQKNYLAPYSELFVFSDASKDADGAIRVAKVRDFLETVEGFKLITIYESKVNKGLADSIIDGVSRIVNQYGKVIVLEDDLITTPNFLDFMNKSLHIYKVAETVQSISGFSLKIKHNLKQSDVYFHGRPFSWGWATWDDRWDRNIFDKKVIQNKINIDAKILKKFSHQCGSDISAMLLDSINDKNNSWYVRWAFDHFNTKRVTVYPFLSKIYNIGFSEDGSHCKGINVFCSITDTEFRRTFILSKPYHDKVFQREFLNYFSKFYKLKFRFNLLGTSFGRKSIMNEIKLRFLIKF
jgi:hypothetical protein